MFDDIVHRYDLLNGLLSFGLDRRWRRAVVNAIRPQHGDMVLDVGTGTGDLARLVEQRGGRVVGVDLSHEMLVAASAKVGSRVILAEGSVFALPFADRVFTGALSGFVLRNLNDLPSAFAELGRVVRPGGRVALVDITEPRQPLLRRGFDAYFRIAAPAMGRLVGKGAAYRYLARSLAQLPPPEEVLRLLEEAGFDSAAARSLTGGMVTLFTGVRAEDRG
jgi:demethylmenaquinone methyltransferase / 2-methoxy-6-polyprenyl-1,4-benzoquinol methylase